MRHIFAAASLFALAACGFAGQDNPQDDENAATAPAGDDNLADAMASSDGAAEQIPDSEQRPEMQLQVTLDRLGFGPGVIDGKMGISTENALSGFQEANGLPVTGELDEATRTALKLDSAVPATRVVTIPADWANERYFAMPDDPADQADMEKLGYVSLDERLAERFHTTVEVLQMLNPGGRPAGAPAATGSATPAATPTPSPSPTPSQAGGTEGFTPEPGPTAIFKAGQQIRVPNIGADRIEPGKVEDGNWQRTLVALGVGTVQPRADRIVVSKSKNTLKTYDTAGKLTAIFTVSSGSSQYPLPLGEWKINGKSFNPDFAYDPALLQGADMSTGKQQLPPGPNSPVGVVWIDLSKEHYGIHGTPEPQTIGRAQSSGCVRLTNWDAARLAQMVSGSTEVLFEA